MTGFVLDSRLQADTVFVADWPLSRVLLMNDARYPWLILVPRCAGATEIFDLPATERPMLMEEIAQAAERLKKLTDATKINIGALGNLVPQLHVHVVARKSGDAAWPGPVWGQGTPIPYERPALEALIGRLVSSF